MVDMVDTEAMEATEAMVDTALEDTGATMASVRLRLSLTTDTVDTEDTVVDTEAMEDTVLDTAGATMASVRLRLSLTTDTVDTEATMASARLRPIPTTAMGAMEDMVDTVEVTEATEDTVMATASNLLRNSSNECYFAQP